MQRVWQDRAGFCVGWPQTPGQSCGMGQDWIMKQDAEY